jgi:hypothetical protein
LDLLARELPANHLSSSERPNCRGRFDGTELLPFLLAAEELNYFATAKTLPGYRQTSA